MTLLDRLKENNDKKYISFWELISHMIAVDEARDDENYVSDESYISIAEALLRLKIHEKVRYFIYDHDNFSFEQIDEFEVNEAKTFLKALLPSNQKKLTPTELVSIQRKFENYFWLKESVEHILPNDYLDFTNPKFYHELEHKLLNVKLLSIESEQLTELQQQNEQLNKELETANTEIENLIKQLAQTEIDFKKSTSSYDYTTPAINIMYAVIREFWASYNPDQPAPKQITITNWITENFEDISPALALNIDKVCRHSDARNGGKYKKS